jgi:hypothetical protein
MKKYNTILLGKSTRTGADAIKKYTPSLGVPYLGVKFGNHLSLLSLGS